MPACHLTERSVFAHVKGPFPGSGPVGVYTIHRDGGRLRQLTPDSMEAAYPDWSPDGRKSVFANNVCFTCGLSDVFVMNPAGHNMRQLIQGFGNNVIPRWSPDGSAITFSHADDAELLVDDIFTMSRHGTNRFNVSQTPAINELGSDWGAEE
jgi:Tol biopolymer transport system component